MSGWWSRDATKTGVGALCPCSQLHAQTPSPQNPDLRPQTMNSNELSEISGCPRAHSASSRLCTLGAPFACIGTPAPKPEGASRSSQRHASLPPTYTTLLRFSQRPFPAARDCELQTRHSDEDFAGTMSSRRRDRAGVCGRACEPGRSRMA